METSTASVTTPSQRRIRCKNCRTILARAGNMQGHKMPTTGIINTSTEPLSLSALIPRGPALLSPECSGYFVQPLTWMSFLDGGEATGKVICPNERCKSKIGNYDWAGVKCSCGEWITPGFCIHRSKVDESA